MGKIAILGASGPTGIGLAAALRERGEEVRAVSRSAARLAAALPDFAIEKLAADMADAGETLRALADTRARCVQVSSYWAYYPQARTVMDETHPRNGGLSWTHHRREAEDVLLQAGAAILHLPDFDGPHVHVSTLQNACAKRLRAGP